MLCVMTHRTMAGPGVTPTRHRKVSGYTMSNSKTKVCATLASCVTVILTDSFNSNMGFLREGAAVEAPTTAVRRALVGGYEVFTRFASGNGLPLLTTIPRGCEPHGATLAAPRPRALFAAVNPHTTCCKGCQFFKTHNVKLTGAEPTGAASSDQRERG